MPVSKRDGRYCRPAYMGPPFHEESARVVVFGGELRHLPGFARSEDGRVTNELNRGVCQHRLVRGAEGAVRELE